MFDGLRVDSKYRDVVAVLSATGARPEEFAKGIQVSVDDTDSLSFEILGAKTHQGKYGQERRLFTVKADRKELAYLHKRVSDSGGGLRVEAASRRSVGQNSTAFQKRSSHRLRSPISAYVFRHQFSADLKASSLSGSEVSVALGHSVDETKSYYGAAQSARSRRWCWPSAR
jgi:integrase